MTLLNLVCETFIYSLDIQSNIKFIAYFSLFLSIFTVRFMLFLPFHSSKISFSAINLENKPILEPYFDLSFRQLKSSCNFDSSLARQVSIEMEFFL